MTEFLSSTRWTMKAEADGFDGGVIFAGGIPLHSLERRKLVKYPHLARRLLDPQFYLARLSFAAASDACTKLASYGWFDAKLPPFDSKQMKQSAWVDAVKAEVEQAWTGTIPTDSATIEDRVRLCIEVQKRLGCEAIVLPAPVATEPSLGFETELEWLDVGLELSSRIAPGIPRLATVAISDVCVRSQAAQYSTQAPIFFRDSRHSSQRTDSVRWRPIDGIRSAPHVLDFSRAFAGPVLVP